MLVDLFAVFTSLVPPVSGFAAVHEVLSLPVTVAAIVLGLCASAAAFRETLKRHRWHPRYLFAVGAPSLTAVLVAAVVALVGALGNSKAGADPPPVRRPVREEVPPVSVIPGTLESDGQVAYAFDRDGRLVELFRRSGKWRIRRLRKHPLSDVTDMKVCGESLVVAFDTGRVARLSRVDGTVEKQRRIAGSDVLIACSGQWVFAVRGEAGQVLRLKAATLEAYSEWVRTGAPIDAVSGDGDRVRLASRSKNRIGVIKNVDGAMTPEAIDWIDDVAAPNGMLATRRQLFVSHAGGRCVTRLDDDGREHMPGRATGGGPTHLAGEGEEVYVASEDSGAVVRITERRRNRIGTYVNVATLPADIAIAAGRMLVVDDGEKDNVRAFTLASLRAARPNGHFQLSAACS